MKIQPDGKILGMSLREQYSVTVILLALNAAFNAIVWIITRSTYDTPTAITSFFFMIASSIGLVAILLKKYDISLIFSLLGAIFSGITILAIASWFFTEPETISFDTLLLVDLIPVMLFSLASLFLWNLEKHFYFNG